MGDVEDDSLITEEERLAIAKNNEEKDPDGVFLFQPLPIVQPEQEELRDPGEEEEEAVITGGETTVNETEDEADHEPEVQELEEDAGEEEEQLPEQEGSDDEPEEGEEDSDNQGEGNNPGGDDNDDQEDEENFIMNEEQVNRLAEALGNQRPAVQSVKIPLFFGDKTDTMTAEQWADTIDRAKNLQNWTEEQTATAAIENWRGNANMWRENLAMGVAADVAAVAAWDLLRPKFIAQFGETTLPAQKVELMLGLKQKKDESAKTFFMRVDNAVKKITKTALAAQAEAAKPGFIACRAEIQRFLFMSGLKGEVRKWVTANMAENPTLEQIRTAAIRADQAEAQRNDHAAALQIAGVSMSQEHGPSMQQSRGEVRGAESLEEEIAALRTQNQQLKSAAKKNKQGTAAGGGAARKQDGAAGGQKKQSQNVVNIPMAERNWILCYNCYQWGQHFAHECQMSKEEGKRMKRQSAREKPSGPAHDSQYPN